MKSVARDIAEAGRNVRSGGIQSLRDAAQPGNVGAYLGGMAGGPAGAFVGESLGNNFILNAAMKAGNDFSKDVIMNVASDYAKYGTGFGGRTLQDKVTNAALSAAAELPIVGGVVNEVVEPMEAAKNRVKGIVGQINRAGGKVSPEAMREVAGVLLEQEGRAFQGAKEVDDMFKSDPTLKEIAVKSSPRAQEALDAAAQGLEALDKVLPGLVQGINDLITAITGGERVITSSAYR